MRRLGVLASNYVAHATQGSLLTPGNISQNFCYCISCRGGKKWQSALCPQFFHGRLDVEQLAFDVVKYFIVLFHKIKCKLKCGTVVVIIFWTFYEC